MRTVSTNVSLFRIRNDGTLEYASKYDVETSGGKSLLWVGLVSLPSADH